MRDVDEGEKSIVRQEGIRGYSMADIDKLGIGEVMKRALDYLSPVRFFLKKFLILIFLFSKKKKQQRNLASKQSVAFEF